MKPSFESQEWDIPGHADSWCAGYPELCPASCHQAEHSDRRRSPLSPAGNLTLAAINGVLASSADVFPDGFVHLGGDEADTVSTAVRAL